MAHQKRFSLCLSLPVGLLIGLSSPSAQATVCKSDADCGKDATCIGVMSVGTGGAPAVTIGSPPSGAGAATGTVVPGTGGVTSTGGGTIVYVPATGGGGMGGTAGVAGSRSAGTAGVAGAGSAGAAGTMGGELIDPTPEPMPTVPVNVIGYCQAPPKTCKSTADCPTDFNCYKPLIATAPCYSGTGGRTGVGGTGGSGGEIVPPKATAGSIATGVSGSAPADSGNASGGTTGSSGTGATSGSEPIAVPPDYPTKCDSTPVESETGYCQAVPRTCTSDSQCPAPLNCYIGPCKDEICPSACTFTPVTCQADSDCADANYECATVSKSRWCTGSAGCSKDGACTTTPPECGTTEIKRCMPKRMDCSAGQACPSGWSCYDSSDHALSAPSWWNVTEAIKVCMPDGIILAVDGHASGPTYFAGSGYRTGGASGGKDGTPTLGGDYGNGGSGGTTGSVTLPPSNSGQPGSGTSETAPTSPAPVNDSSSPSGATATATATATAISGPKPEAGGGCSFGGSGSGAWALVLTGLALALRIRRKRA